MVTPASAPAALDLQDFPPFPITTEPVKLLQRRPLPAERKSITHRFCIDGHKGYLTVGLYDDGVPGELFVRLGKEGSTVNGFADGVAILTSIALQYGLPLPVLAAKFIGGKFEPRGTTVNEAIPLATSVLDYVFRWMLMRFCPSAPIAKTDPIEG